MPEVHIGTSGWSFPEWKATFYAGVPQRGWLQHYASVFSTVEVNMTFRRSLTAAVVAKWRDAVGDDFRFAVKAHQRLTHRARLADPDDTVPFFAETARLLGGALGPILVQTPPNLARDDDLLRGFLAAWPEDLSAAFEFRHASWFDDGVYSLLADAGAALVAAETADAAPVLVDTAPFAYVRLRADAYPDDVLDSWTNRLAALQAEQAWVYFKHEALSTERAMALAARFS
jgi:uncharacterized protein YecE (DUF72 family)